VTGTPDPPGSRPPNAGQGRRLDPQVVRDRQAALRGGRSKHWRHDQVPHGRRRPNRPPSLFDELCDRWPWLPLALVAGGVVVWALLGR
jgi:hypothetical protein